MGEGEKGRKGASDIVSLPCSHSPFLRFDCGSCVKPTRVEHRTARRKGCFAATGEGWGTSAPRQVLAVAGFCGRSNEVRRGLSRLIGKFDFVGCRDVVVCKEKKGG